MVLQAPFHARVRLLAILITLASTACQVPASDRQTESGPFSTSPPRIAQSASPEPTATTPSSRPYGRIAFSRTGGPSDEIYLVDTRNSDLQPLATGGSFNQWPSWSPDAEKIAFASDLDGSRGMFDLYIAEVGTAGLRRLTSDPATWEIQPSWAPDGRLIAFTIVTFDGTRGSDIWLIDAEGQSATNLTESTALEESPLWSPSGAQIAYLSRTDSAQDQYDLYVMREDGSDQQLIARDVSDKGLGWSPDGAWIAFASASSAVPSLELVRADGSEMRSLPIPSVQRAKSPAWSPDGAWIAFSGVVSSDSGIFVVSTDGSVVLRLTANPLPGWDGSPAWAPRP